MFLSICLPVRHSIRLSIRLSAFLSVSLPTSLSACPYVCLSDRLSVRLTVYSVPMFLCLATPPTPPTIHCWSYIEMVALLQQTDTSGLAQSMEF